MRIDRPVGTLLLLFPTLAALWMASNGTPDTVTLILFVVGTFVMRSAGCVINDIADRNVDPYVQRTQNRPLARHAISIKEAALVGAILIASAAVIALLLKPQTLIWAVFGAVLAGAYPFAKRYTYIPQVLLGCAFSWGIVLAFIQVKGFVTTPGWILFVGSVLWIVAYDTFYAMVDRDDDIQIGVKSTAILFGDGAVLMIGFLQVSTLFVWYLVGENMQYSAPYFIALAVIAGLFFWQQQTVRVQPSLHGDQAALQKAAYLTAFQRNIYVGLALFIGMVVEYAVNTPLLM